MSKLHHKATAMAYSLISYALGSGSLVAIILWLAFDEFFQVIPTLVSFENGLAALGWNVLLIIGFGFKHTSMAREPFKNWYLRYFPEVTLRSTYVLATGMYVFLMFALWAPMSGSVWQAGGSLEVVAFAGVAIGWTTLFVATFTIDHFELFGVSQAWRYCRNQAPTVVNFTQRGLYNWVRHPIMTGLLIALWCTPNMTADRFTLVIAMTIYVFVGLFFEERSLKRNLGKAYEEYCDNVGMLLPKLGMFSGRSKNCVS